MEAYNISDLRDIAQRRLPKMLFECLDRGAEDEVSLRNNRAVFERIWFKPRTMNDVSQRNQDTTLFGRTHRMPLVIAPTGFAGLMCYEGELAVAHAAARAGIPFTLANSSLTPMEKIAEEAGGELWFQLYIGGDRAKSYRLVERAKASGYKALVVTVDNAAQPNREYNKRNHFFNPIRYTPRNVVDVLMHPRWLAAVWLRYLLTTGAPQSQDLVGQPKAKAPAAPPLRLPTVNIDDIRALRKAWPHEFLVKGVMHPRDALRAVECGADAVVVSNHGGRTLDGSPSPLQVLPEILDAVGKQVPVLVDGGFRRGGDVVKALAMGAQAVQIGRPGLYGVAAEGPSGADHALAIFRDEIDRVMGYLGCRTIADIDAALLLEPDGSPQYSDPGVALRMPETLPAK